MPEARHIDGSLAAELPDGGLAGDALAIYERVLPALPASITRTRTELADALAYHDLASGRRDDILLVTTEAATNAVLYTYLATHPGPVYVAAELIGQGLTVSVTDRGRGSFPARTVPGWGSAWGS